MKVETGVLHDQFPYVRVGSGRQPLVVLPGLNLDNRTANGLVARSYGQGFRRLTAEHTLYIVQRPRGVSALADMRQIAAEYAELLSQELGQVRLMGLSTGRVIAQHIALDHPELVQRLVLVVSGARLSARGRDICRRWLELAHYEQWRRLRGEMAAVFGGADDPFFPEPLRKTAAAIPRAELRVYPHSGHGLPKRHGKQLQEHVLKFLAAP
jgi:pimeloyl-ACP methyl ester carboxylesterase